MHWPRFTGEGKYGAHGCIVSSGAGLSDLSALSVKRPLNFESDADAPRAESRSPASYGNARYSCGTSVNPHLFSWRAHVPRLSEVTRKRSIGMI
jgi:hypothetical protein